MIFFLELIFQRILFEYFTNIFLNALNLMSEALDTDEQAGAIY